MNKNLIVVLYFALAALGLLALVVVMIFAPTLLKEFTPVFLQVLGLASTAAVTIYLLGHQSAQIAEVKAQTNGNLTKLTEERDSLQRQLLAVVGTSPAVDRAHVDQIFK